MKRTVYLLIACILTLLVQKLPIVQAAEPTGVIFEAIDSMKSTDQGGTRLIIDGLVQGESQPRTVSFGFSAAMVERCEKLALMVISRPGRFLLQIPFAGDGNTSCKLIRR